MKLELLVLLAAVTLSVAMVPRTRRAVHLDDDKKSNASQATEICLPQTPCAWIVYKSHTRIIETTIVNTYCKCMPGTMCQPSAEESSNDAAVHHCKPPTEDTES